MDYEQICAEVRATAREAGEYIALQRESFSFADVEFKGFQDMVSYVDKQAERMIVDRLREITPEAGFITEEGTCAAQAGEAQSLKWIIDPLDGTTNFIHGLPPYCVSIGLMEEDEMVVGVVYEITMKEMFWAWKGSAAFLDGREITVSATDSLENALIAVGFAHNTRAETDGYLGSMAWFQKNSNGIRRIGSATADLVYVACGRFDAFHQVKLSAWDVAAGAFICRAAGAVVSDYSGGENYIFGREIIASNPHIYKEFKSRVK